MEKSFWGVVGQPFNTGSIKSPTLAEAVVIAFDSDKYCFYGSNWFIDIKNIFRIFRFNDTIYIAKKTKINKANLEIENSKKAYQRLEGKTIGTKTIKIVVPKKITLSTNGEYCYLVAVYFGQDLNGYLYSHTKHDISLQDCLSVVRLLLESGVCYRGFIPRNIIVKDDYLYLFDWEDASFTDSPSFIKFDHLWRTIFLLNWSYIFNLEDLEDGLKKRLGVRPPLIEPALVKYEKIFRSISNDKTSIHYLRNHIDKIVFGSESPLKTKPDSFYLRPNDVGHLVSDVLPGEIEVLYNVLSYVFRKHDEHKFSYHIQFMTHLVSKYYKMSLVQNRPSRRRLQYYVLVSILMMVDEYISEASYKNILSANILSKSMTKISQISKKKSVTGLFLSMRTDELSQLLDIKLRDRIIEAFPKAERHKISSIDNAISSMLYEANIYQYAQE